MKSVKVIYQGPYDKETDDAVKRALDSVGGVFWASGFNFETGERDLCFDLPGANRREQRADDEVPNRV